MLIDILSASPAALSKDSSHNSKAATTSFASSTIGKDYSLTSMNLVKPEDETGTFGM